MTIPKRVFIVPYRKRETYKKILTEKLSEYLKDENDWELYFSHQCDERPFNRGAIKNIGFLAIKDKYPNHYKDITFIFHDVDTYPSEKGLIDYTTTDGVVKHFYGFTFSLGGIFAIKGKDFEKTRGFPNFWGWGLEDNIIQDRCISNNLTIDRSNFFSINDNRIIREFDGINRLVSKGDISVYKYKKSDDFTFIKNMDYEIDDKMINIKNFDVKLNLNDQEFFLRNQIINGIKMNIPPGHNKRNWTMKRIYTL